jgi:hypothetical protein
MRGVVKIDQGHDQLPSIFIIEKGYMGFEAQALEKMMSCGCFVVDGFLSLSETSHQGIW